MFIRIRLMRSDRKAGKAYRQHQPSQHRRPPRLRDLFARGVLAVRERIHSVVASSCDGVVVAGVCIRLRGGIRTIYGRREALSADLAL